MKTQLRALFVSAVAVAALSMAACGDDEEEGSGKAPEPVKTALKQMNEELKKLAPKAKDLSVEKFGQEISALEARKKELMGLFPKVLGLEFGTVYSALKELDDLLRKAVKAWVEEKDVVGPLKDAKKSNAALEKLLKESPDGVVDGYLDPLKEMDKELEELIKEAEKPLPTDEDERSDARSKIKRAIYAVQASKVTFMRLTLPNIYTRPFSRIYAPLELLDLKLEEARAEKAAGKDPKQKVEEARDQKDELLEQVS